MEEQNYEYYSEEKQNYKYFSEDTYTTQDSNMTQTTTTKAPITNPCNPMQWKRCNEGQFTIPWLVTKGIIPLPKPWGNRCSKALKEYIKRIKMNGTQRLNMDEINWLWVSEFPNLPYYGNLTVLPEGSNQTSITTNKIWYWMTGKNITIRCRTLEISHCANRINATTLG